MIYMKAKRSGISAFFSFRMKKAVMEVYADKA